MKDQRKTKTQLIAELEALRQSDERYRQIFESANDAIISLTLDGIITTTNRGAEVLLGWPREERVGRHYREFLTPPSVTFTQERACRIQAGEKVSSIYEIELLRKDGSVVPVEARSRFIRDREGKPIGILAIHRDITARKRAEATIIEWKNRYEAAIQASRQVFYDWDPHTNKAIQGGCVEQLYGCSAEEVPSDLAGMIELIHPDDREAFRQEIDRVITTKTPFHLEYRMRRKDGSYITIEDQGCFFRDSMGNAVRMVGFLVDITERKRAEEALQESERRYRNLFENANDAIISVSLDGIITAVNRGLEVMTGWSRKELISQHYRVLATPHLITLEEERTRRALAREKLPSVYEAEVRRKDGSVMPVEGKSRFIRDHEGKPIGSQTIFRDITARKQAEAALQESERRFRSLVQYSSDIITVLSAEGIIRYQSPSIERLLGYTPTELLGKRVAEFTHPEDWPHVRKTTAPVRDNPGVPTSTESRFRHKNGSWRVFEAVITNLLEVPGVAGIVINSRDITGRKQAEEEKQKLQEQLFQARKLEALGTLAGGVAHDFNNMLSAIMGFTELVTDEVPESTVARRNLEEVLKASRRAKTLVKQILTFSRPHQQTLEPIQLQPVVEEVLTFLQASLPETIELRRHIDKTAGLVAISPTQLQQVLTNLCANATQALQERSGVLEVSLQQIEVKDVLARTQNNLKPGPYIQLTVSDTGCGMTSAVQERVFEPFFTTRPVGEGNGLGLAIVHGIVTGHGGGITVESTPGKGTTFHVYLPVRENDVAPENILPYSPSPARGDSGDEKGAPSDTTHCGY